MLALDFINYYYVRIENLNSVWLDWMNQSCIVLYS